MHIRIGLLACVAVATPAHAQHKAAFLDGTYTMSAEACGKLQVLAQGGPKTISTVPWSVDRNGISYWEGGCGFTRITQQLKGRKWLVVASCSDGPDKSKETYTWARNANGTFAVTLKGEKTARLYTRCDLSKGN